MLRNNLTLVSAVKRNTVDELLPQNSLEMRLLAASQYLLEQILLDSQKVQYASDAVIRVCPSLKSRELHTDETDNGL